MTKQRQFFMSSLNWIGAVPLRNLWDPAFSHVTFLSNDGSEVGWWWRFDAHELLSRLFIYSFSAMQESSHILHINHREDDKSILLVVLWAKQNFPLSSVKYVHYTERPTSRRSIKRAFTNFVNIFCMYLLDISYRMHASNNRGYYLFSPLFRVKH